jgi:hypothetical protein
MIMSKTVVDKLTVNKKMVLRETKMKGKGIAHSSEVNGLDKDSTNRNLISGVLTRTFPLYEMHLPVKKISLCIDFRPMQDAKEKIDLFIEAKLLRNGQIIDKLVIKFTKELSLQAGGNNSIEFALTDRKIFNEKCTQEGDEILIKMTSSLKTKKVVYLGNMYITKE